MQGTERFEVTSFLGCGNKKQFFKVQCKETLQFFTMEVVSNEFIHGGPNLTVPQFGSVAESVPNWDMPFCMELRFVFETPQTRYYILDFVGEANLADLMNDGLPEPTVLFIAAELGLALGGLHELGVSYNELNLRNVAVDNKGHVLLWREFEGKEYWHISECICGVHGVNCGKITHEVKRRGMNVPPGQRHWEDIAQNVQDDWRTLGALLCQLLTGQVDFHNQSVEEVIISLFITPNTKDLLYGLVTGAVQLFEDLKWHPCFDGLDWEEVKSKSVQSPLMANFRSRFHSTTSSRFSKSPSLQNIYTAGMSARKERGVFRQSSSISRTHSTSDLHSYSLGNARPTSFDKGMSDRRSTLCVPYNRGGENGHERQRLGMQRNETTNMQENRDFPSGNFRGYSRSVGSKSSLSLKRQVLEQRNFDRPPPCLSAPTSPRNSLDTTQSYVYPHASAPSSPQGSVETIHSSSSSSLQSTTTGAVFNEPETNPFHEEYKKRWGSTTLDTAYGIYSSNLKLNNDSTIPGSGNELGDRNQLQINPSTYGSHSRALNNNSYGGAPCKSDGPIHSNQPNTYAISNGFYSQLLRQNDNSTIPDKGELTPINLRQPTSYTTEMLQQRNNTRHYSIDVSSGNAGIYNNSRNSPNNSTTNRSYFRTNDFPNTSMQQQSLGDGNVDSHSGTCFSNSQFSLGNSMNNLTAVDRTNVHLNISDEQNQHSPQRRRGSLNLDTTNGIQSLRSQNPTSNKRLGKPNGLNQAEDTVNSPNNEQFQKQKGSINSDTTDEMYSSFFQTSPNNQNESVSTERRNSKETASILFQQHFRSRRGSVDAENSDKVSPNSRNTDSNHTRTYGGVENYSRLRTVPNEDQKNDYHESVQLRDTTDTYSQERVQERTAGLQTAPNSFMAIPPRNTPFEKRNSRSPEPVVAIHPSTLQVPSNNPRLNLGDMSTVLSDDVDEFNSFQKQSQRRRSSTDVASLSSVQMSTSKSETPSRKTTLSRSMSYSNVSDGFGSSKNDAAKSGGQTSCRRSMALRPIPSFEEFRTMRALSKMAYGEDGIVVNQKYRNDDYKESCKDRNDYNSSRSDSNGNNSNNDSNNNSIKNTNNSSNNNNKTDDNYNSSNFTETTTRSPTNNPVIQDLLVKYGLDKGSRSGSTLRLYLDPTKRADTREGNSPTPSAQNNGLETTLLDTTDTKQRLLNILDDFLAVRNKHKTLSTSSSMGNLKASHLLGDQRRPSLPSTLIEEHQTNTTNDYAVNSTRSLGVSRGLPVKGSRLIDSENYECGDAKELSSPSSEHNKTEEYTNPSLVISSPNSAGIVERTKNRDTSSDNQSKVENSSKRPDGKNYSESPRRRSKKSNTAKKYAPEVQLRDNRATSPREQPLKVTLEEWNTDTNQSDKCTISLTPEVKPKEREVSRRVSEHARDMARRHRESMELVKKTGRKAKNERRKSFTQALQNENKELSSEHDDVISRENVPSDIQPVVKSSGPIRGDHSVEIEAPSVEQRDMKYLRLKHRRTSSLLSLTDYLGRDDFEQKDDIQNHTESLSECDEESEIFDSNPVGRENSFLSVKSDTDFPRGRQASLTESSSSLLSRGSSFHSNFSADSGSVHLDFEDCDVDDDDLFYIPEPHEKSESEIQRNDSGLGDEIGVATRVKKRWEDLGHVSARQSMIVASSQELATKKDERFEEGQPKADGRQEIQQKNSQQQQQGRKVSRDRRISRDRQPNAIDCPDCGRAFVVEKDKPSVKSRGPNQSLICYKCQSHLLERKEAIIELVQTEINYGNDFEIIKEEFLSPMQTGGIVSPDNLAKIFLNIQELLDVSTKFCKKIESSIEECVNKNDEELCHMNVGSIFVENVELLQAYELYCSKQPDAISLLESLQKKNDVLRVFLNITCRENPKCRKMDINSFLLAPVQRVTKYPLLLSRIRRTTPRWHGDREDLKLAQRKVEEQITKINSLTKSSETKTRKFQSNLGTSDGVDSYRLKKLASDVLAWTLDEMQLLMHGQLKVLCSEFGGGQSWTKRAMKRSVETHLLFCIRGQNEPIKVDSEDDDNLQFPNTSEISDASLLLLKRKSNGKYTLFRDEIKLRDCVVYEETEPDLFGLVHMGRESFQFTARTSKNARKWMKYLKLQTRCQGKWRRRRNASANIMLKTS